MIQEREINLFNVVQVILQRGVKILTFTLVCMMLAALSTLFIQNRYEANALLQMNKSKIGEHTMTNPAIPMNTYQELFSNNEIYYRLLNQYPELTKAPYNFKYPQDLKKRVGVGFSGMASIIALSLELESAEMAATVLNAMAELVIEKNKALMEFEKKTSRMFIEEELRRVQEELELYRETYLNLLKQNQKPILIAELNSKISTLSLLEQSLDTLDHSIAELQTKEDAFKEIFSATNSSFNPTFVLRRSVVIDPVLSKKVEEMADSDLAFDEIKDISFFDESVNTAYVENYTEFMALKANLPALIEKRNSMRQRVRELKPVIHDMQQRLDEMELEEMLAKANLDRTLEVLSGIDKQVGWVGTTVATERQDLILWSPAVPINKKVYPNRSLIVGTVGLLAFLLSFIFYLLADLYGLLKVQAPSV